MEPRGGLRKALWWSYVEVCLFIRASKKALLFGGWWCMFLMGYFNDRGVQPAILPVWYDSHIVFSSLDHFLWPVEEAFVDRFGIGPSSPPTFLQEDLDQLLEDPLLPDVFPGGLLMPSLLHCID